MDPSQPRSGGPTRRSFTPSQKLEHLACYEAAAAGGAGGAYLREQGLYKPERVLASRQGAEVVADDGRTLINMCANNYLGLADHPVVQMEGTAVFRWAPFAMVEVVHQALASAGVSVDDLDAFIPHQANLRITQTLCRNIKLPESVAVATDIVEAGNTSAASVPLAMEAMLRSGQARAGDLALLIAFGAGLSFAGQVVTLPPHQSPGSPQEE